MNYLVLFFTSLLVFTNNVAYAEPSPYQVKADFLCAQVIENPKFKYEDYFDPAFIAKIKYDVIVGILKDIYKDDGVCKKAAISPINENSFKAFLHTEKTSFKFIITLDSKNLISGLMYKGRTSSKVSIKNSSDLNKELKKVSGIKSIYFKELSKKTPAINIKSNTKMAIGSEFKLYVLNDLVHQINDKKTSWTNELAIQEEYKSLPSGKLQDEANGKKFSIKQMAELMISISDNTATDHLMAFLGQESIIKSLNGLNSFINLNSPFLSTMDLFRIKTLGDHEVENYLKLNANAKSLFLKDLGKKLDRNQTLKLLEKWEKPKDILKTEWFGTTQDVCKVMESLQKKSVQDSTIIDILSKNVPFIDVTDSPYFKYLGYKGGSEPGVLTMTFLIQSKNDSWGCLSVAYNDEKSNYNEEQLADLTHAILEYVGTKLK